MMGLLSYYYPNGTRPPLNLKGQPARVTQNPNPSPKLRLQLSVGPCDLLAQAASACSQVRATCEYDDSDTRTCSCMSPYPHTRRSLTACG